MTALPPDSREPAAHFNVVEVEDQKVDIRIDASRVSSAEGLGLSSEQCQSFGLAIMTL